MKHTSKERAAVDAALLRLKLDFDEETREKLITNLKLVIEKNNVLNLTRIDSFEGAVVLHMEDSLSIYPEFMHSSGEFCDIGTGEASLACRLPSLRIVMGSFLIR